MRLTFTLQRTSPDGRTRWRLTGNPLTLVLLIGLIAGAGCATAAIGGLIYDAYFPYEGEVTAITTSWVDWMVFDIGDWEHLQIRTPEGAVIDRRISMEHRIRQCITVGDYVVKPRGFGNRVRTAAPVR